MQVEDTIEFETALMDERARIVRLCSWFSGSPEAAEDLAQETLIAAWKSRDQLISPDKLKPWITSIARNVCLSWSRGHYREQGRLAYSIDANDEPFEESLPDETDLEVELDRAELASLLDRALSLLPADTAQMLVEHYIKQSSHAEIADMMRINPGTVAVRLQRGKLTLQKLLRTDLQTEASAFGLVHPSGSEWEETNIWCPGCGQSRLLGKYQKHKVFALRCPTCDPEADSLMAGLDLTKPYHAALLGNVKTYKPAYTRLLTAFTPLYEQALRSHTAPCLACGSRLEVFVEHDKPAYKHFDKFTQITLYCPACDWASNKSLLGLVLASSEGLRFWRDYPRIRAHAPQEVELHGSMAYLTRLQSVTNSAELILISRHDTCEILEVHANVKL